MQPVALNPAALFFHEHANYAYPTGTSNPEPFRVANAVGLAVAESLLHAAQHLVDVSVVWDRDYAAEHDDRLTEGEPCAMYQCALMVGTSCVASLGAIDSAPESDYARVVEAQLAQEAEAALQEAIAHQGRSQCNCARRLAFRRGS